jgi:RNA polymerase-binding protein DksA
LLEFADPANEESVMQSTRLQHYRGQLLAKRSELVGEIDRICESIPEEVRPPGEHEIAASEGIDVDISLALGDGSRLRDIDAALDRIKEATYGKCSQCGCRIPAARLEAVPEARYCVGCDGSHHGS